MANVILDKFATPAAMTISLGGLASSVTGVGRQADFVDNSTTRYQDILLSVKIKQGTSPTGNKAVRVYLLRAINSVYDDNAGASDAAITVLNAALIGVLSNLAAPSTGNVLAGSFRIRRPGPSWSVAIVHDTVAALDATDGNHAINWIGMNPEVQ